MKLQNLPVKKLRVTSPYGPRERNQASFHYGVDLGPVDKTRPHEPIYAAADGVVQVAKDNPDGYGLYIVIETTNLEVPFCALYGHLHKLNVQVGDPVIAGQQIGIMGNTGDSDGVHLHFEIRNCSYLKFWDKHLGEYFRRIDPINYLLAVEGRLPLVRDGAEAIGILTQLGLINPATYWLKAIDTVKYLEGLLIKLTNHIIKTRA